MHIKHQSRRVLGVALVALTVAGCDYISPIEANPNAVPQATVDQLFTGAQVSTFLLASGGLGRIASIWTQQMAGTDRQLVSFDNYTITEADFDDEFDGLYTGGGLVDLRNATAQAEAAGRSVYAGIIKVHEAYQVGMISSFFGDIPYSEAVNPDVEEPALDDQAAVYAAIQSLLDEAIADLAGGGAGPGAVDMNFGGDAAAWTAIANTLKARFHMHWAEVNGAASYTAARTAALAGVSSAAGTWKAQFGTASTEQNVWFQFLRDRSGYISAGDHLVPLMIANADPRIGIYYSETSPGVYTPRSSSLSTTGFGASDYDIPIVTCAENQFILAEAEFNLSNEPAAIAAAQAGLACEEAEYGVSLAAEVAAVGGLAGAALLDKILEQKYVAQFLSSDTFNDYKRTCRPAITERPNGMPGRLFYSVNERIANSNIPDAGTDPNDKYNDNDPTPC